MVGGGYTVAACWHVTPALLVVVASVMHVHPLPSTIALLGTCALELVCMFALGMREP
jgi:hypothetical protein